MFTIFEQFKKVCCIFLKPSMEILSSTLPPGLIFHKSVSLEFRRLSVSSLVNPVLQTVKQVRHNATASQKKTVKIDNNSKGEEITYSIVKKEL